MTAPTIHDTPARPAPAAPAPTAHAPAGAPAPGGTAAADRALPGRAGLDLRLMAVTIGDVDDALIARCVDLARGGATCIQVRVKHPRSDRELLAGVSAVAEAVHRAAPECRVLVDDRADIAFAARHRGVPVAGVHLGHTDLPVAAARAMLGPDAVVGLTTGTLELIAHARAHGDALDYVGAGPFRPTPTKRSPRPPIGLAGYPMLVAAAHVPIVAIGDVGVDDLAALRRTGVAGAAMARPLMHAPDAGAAARACREAWAEGAAPSA